MGKPPDTARTLMVRWLPEAPDRPPSGDLFYDEENPMSVWMACDFADESMARRFEAKVRARGYLTELLRNVVTGDV